MLANPPPLAVPAEYAFQVYQGDDAYWQFRFWDDAARTQPSDLTAVLFAAQIRDEPGGLFVVDLICSLAISPNVVGVQLVAADSARLPLGGVWDLEFTYPGGTVRTVASGPVLVTPDVTRAASKREELVA